MASFYCFSLGQALPSSKPQGSPRREALQSASWTSVRLSARSLPQLESFVRPTVASGVISHMAGWKIPELGFLARKITYFYGPWLPASHVWLPEGRSWLLGKPRSFLHLLLMWQVDKWTNNIRIHCTKISLGSPTRSINTAKKPRCIAGWALKIVRAPTKMKTQLCFKNWGFITWIPKSP